MKRQCSPVSPCGYSRRDLLKHGSLLLAAAQAGVLATQSAADENPKGGASVGAGFTSKSDPSFVVADTTSGKIRGFRLHGGISEFRGVPYGATTAGANRFMPPRKPASWSGVRDTLGVGDRAPQILRPGVDYLMSFGWDRQPGGMGEDCLNLSIWTPGLRDGGKRPIMVSLHGGGWWQGSGNADIFAGDALARFGDVVVVSPNHRLNVFGFLNLAGIGAPPEFAQAGVSGLLDLVQVLEWVRDNAESFGGDPNNVTIFGNSGGGYKVSTLLSMPRARGLFHRAIVQSGSLVRFAELQQQVRLAEQMLATLRIDKKDIKKLQTVSFAQIVEAARQFSGGTMLPGSPVMDGNVLPRHPFDPDAPQISAHVPMIVGTVLDDGAHSLFVSNERGPYTEQLLDGRLDQSGLENLVRQRFEGSADTLLAAYRKAYPHAAPFFIYGRILTDRGFRKNALQQVERKAQQAGAPVWMYRFDYPSPAYGGKFGAVHGVEVEYTFNSHRQVFSGGSGSKQDQRIATMMASTWVAFARTGNPNNSTIPGWQPYDADRRQTMLFNLEPRVENDPDAQLRKLAAETVALG